MNNYYSILKTTEVYLKDDGKPKTSKYFKLLTVVEPLYNRMKFEKNS